jgi:hypothetical protein
MSANSAKHIEKALEPEISSLKLTEKKVITDRELRNIVNKLDSGDTLVLLVRREQDGAQQEFIRTLRIPE